MRLKGRALGQAQRFELYEALYVRFKFPVKPLAGILSIPARQHECGRDRQSATGRETGEHTAS